VTAVAWGRPTQFLCGIRRKTAHHDLKPRRRTRATLEADGGPHRPQEPEPLAATLPGTRRARSVEYGDDDHLRRGDAVIEQVLE